MNELTDDYLRKIWCEADGRFHGPLVETGTMTEENLLKFLRGIIPNNIVGQMDITTDKTAQNTVIYYEHPNLETGDYHLIAIKK